MKSSSLTLLALLLLASCAAPRPAAFAPAAHPGFDAWQYPGDGLMATWKATSPYQWVGFYLPAPCHRDSSWAGRRAALEGMGWGLAVLYVGQQVFEGAPPPDTTAGTPIVCSRTLLTPAQGRIDAADAVRKAAAEGFVPGTILYLNVEHSTNLPDAMVAYYRAWMEAVVENGRYVPGTYVHRRHADALYVVAREVYGARGQGAEVPPFWVAGGSDFGLEKRPEAVGLGYASIWQGVLDVPRTWGEKTLRVDENVARRPSPSAPLRAAPAGR